MATVKSLKDDVSSVSLSSERYCPVNPIEILVIKYVFIVYHIVREEMNFVPLSDDIVTFDVDRDVSTAILLVFIRQRGRLFTCLHGRT